MSDHWKSIARLLIISALIAPLHAHLQNAAKPAIIHGPYLQNPTENSVTVIWFTNEACTSWVKGRAFAAEVDPRAKPGAPAAVEKEPSPTASTI